MEFSKEILTDSKYSLVSTGKRKKSDGFEGRTELFLLIRFRLEVNLHYYRFSTQTSLKFLTFPLDFRSNTLLPPNFVVSKPMIMKNRYDDEDNLSSVKHEHEHGSLHANYSNNGFSICVYLQINQRMRKRDVHSQCR